MENYVVNLLVDEALAAIRERRPTRTPYKLLAHAVTHRKLLARSLSSLPAIYYIGKRPLQGKLDFPVTKRSRTKGDMAPITRRGTISSNMEIDSHQNVGGDVLEREVRYAPNQGHVTTFLSQKKRKSYKARTAAKKAKKYKEKIRKIVNSFYCPPTTVMDDNCFTEGNIGADVGLYQKWFCFELSGLTLLQNVQNHLNAELQKRYKDVNSSEGNFRLADEYFLKWVRYDILLRCKAKTSPNPLIVDWYLCRCKKNNRYYSADGSNNLGATAQNIWYGDSYTTLGTRYGTHLTASGVTKYEKVVTQDNSWSVDLFDNKNFTDHFRILKKETQTMAAVGEFFNMAGTINFNKKFKTNFIAEVTTDGGVAQYTTKKIISDWTYWIVVRVRTSDGLALSNTNTLASVGYQKYKCRAIGQTKPSPYFEADTDVVV